MSGILFVLPMVAAVNQLIAPGALHVVPLDKPVTVHAHVGDLIHLEYAYPIALKTIPRALKVDVAGLSVRGLRVVSCPREGFGAGCLAAVLTATGPGESVVTVTPIGVEGAKPIRVKIVVRFRDPRPLPVLPGSKKP